MIAMLAVLWQSVKSTKEKYSLKWSVQPASDLGRHGEQ